METRRALILAARRTPIGRAGGYFDRLEEYQLLGPVIDAVLDEAGAPPESVDQVIMGNAAGPGGNVARVAVLASKLPMHTPATTIDQQCSSGLEAINFGARLVQTGAADVVIVGGVESVSTAPWRQSRPINQNELPVIYNRARFTPRNMDDPEMGVAAEIVAERFEITRERQDAFAVTSHARVLESQERGVFDGEIVPLKTRHGLIEKDENPRPGLTIEKLSRFKAAFVPGGTVTAGNCCPRSDGAAAMIITTEEKARAWGHSSALEFVDSGTGAVAPDELGVAAVPAAQSILRRHPDLAVDDLELVEFNEAFASQTIACLDLLGINPERVNLQGGAIALGHPYGASGAILVTRLFTQLLRSDEPRDGVLALALMAAAGGVGAATLLRSVKL